MDNAEKKIIRVVTAVLGAYAILILALAAVLLAGAFAFVSAEETFAPGKNPVVEGKDVCRVSAAAAQNYLALTDDIWRFINGPAAHDEERREALYAKALEYQGMLEIASSVCLGVGVDPSRLSPEQQAEMEREKVEL